MLIESCRAVLSSSDIVKLPKRGPAEMSPTYRGTRARINKSRPSFYERSIGAADDDDEKDRPYKLKGSDGSSSSNNVRRGGKAASNGSA